MFKRQAVWLSTKSLRFVISNSPWQAASLTWSLSQTIWVGGVWLMLGLVLPAIEAVQLAPLLTQEVVGRLWPALILCAAMAVAIQISSLWMLQGRKALLRLRGQLLLAALGLFFLEGIIAGYRLAIGPTPIIPYVLSVLGLVLVLLPAPTTEG